MHTGLSLRPRLIGISYSGQADTDTFSYPIARFRVAYNRRTWQLAVCMKMTFSGVSVEPPCRMGPHAVGGGREAIATGVSAVAVDSRGSALRFRFGVWLPRAVFGLGTIAYGRRM